MDSDEINFYYCHQNGLVIDQYTEENVGKEKLPGVLDSVLNDLFRIFDKF